MTDLIREIEEEVQQDAVRDFVKKYAALIIGLLVAVVLGISGYLWWRQAQANKALEGADTFGTALQAFQNDDTQAGFQALAELQSSTPGYALLGGFEAASRHSAAGNVDAAIASWDMIIENDETQSQYRELASIFKGMAQASMGDFDAAIASVSAVPTTSVGFGAKALELSALFKWDKGDTGGALADFQALQQLIKSPTYLSAGRQTIEEGSIEAYVEQLQALESQ